MSQFPNIHLICLRNNRRGGPVRGHILWVPIAGPADGHNPPRFQHLPHNGRTGRHCCHLPGHVGK